MIKCNKGDNMPLIEKKLSPPPFSRAEEKIRGDKTQIKEIKNITEIVQFDRTYFKVHKGNNMYEFYV